MFTPIIDLLRRSVGRCPRCMRTAFLTALMAWLLAFGAMSLGGASVIAAGLTLLAVGLTLLWLTHIGVFALRVAAAARRAAGAEIKTEPAAAPQPFSRRQFAAEFARALAGAAAATALTLGATAAFAACDCTKCRSDQVCCRTVGSSCGCFPAGIQC